MAVSFPASEGEMAINVGEYQKVVKVGFWQTNVGKTIIAGVLALAAYALTGVVDYLNIADNRTAVEGALQGSLGDFTGLTVSAFVAVLQYVRSTWFDKTTPNLHRLSE